MRLSDRHVREFVRCTTLRNNLEIGWGQVVTAAFVSPAEFRASSWARGMGHVVLPQ